MLDDVQANRTYKASVFSTLFSEPQVTLELYNAVTGQNYPPDTKIDIVSKSPNLSGYSELVAEVNRNREKMELQDAIVAAIKTCTSKGILLSFLESHASDVLNMIFTEWNLENALAVAKENCKQSWKSSNPGNPGSGQRIAHKPAERIP